MAVTPASVGCRAVKSLSRPAVGRGRELGMDDEDGFSTTPTPRQNPILSFARDHVTLVSSVLAALIFAIRCVVVSKGDLYTASILLTETSLGDAIRALLFSLGPILLTIGALLAAMTAEERYEWSAIQALGVIAASAIVIAISFYLSGQVSRWTYLIYFLFLGLLAWSSIRKRRTRPRETLGTRSLLAFAAFMAVLFASASLAADDFWLPRERLQFKGKATFTGYVLNTGEGHIVILKDDPRLIIEKPQEELEDRDFCYPEDHKARSSSLAADSPVCP